MRRRILYELCDLDGNVIMTDNANKIADYVCCEDSTIRDYASRGHVLAKKYKVRLTGKREPAWENKNPEPEIDYSTNKYECLKMHLKTYGNTVVTFDPVPYFPWLLDEGLNCRCHEKKDFTTKKESKKGRHSKPSYYYVVEVVK